MNDYLDSMEPPINLWQNKLRKVAEYVVHFKLTGHMPDEV
jgi:hypothetical protein